MARTLARISLVVLLTGLMAATGTAATPHHPLSQIYPADDNLSLGGHWLTGLDGIATDGGLAVQGDIALDGRLAAGTIEAGGITITGDRITGLLGDGCGSGRVVTDLHPNGSFSCQQVLTNGSAYLATDGGNLSGALDMDGHPIRDIGSGGIDISGSGIHVRGRPVTGLPTPVSSSDAVPKGFLDSRYLALSGGTMNGTLDLDGHPITNANRISGTSNNLRFMRDGTSDDGTYEWAGWYSGSSRAGIFLWDGSWNGCTSNMFCIIGDTHQLMLRSQKRHVRIDDTLNINSGGTSGGFHIDGADALTGTPANGWLRLNQGNAFNNGVYTPGFMRVDGGMQLRGDLNIRGAAIRDSTGNLTVDDSMRVHGTVWVQGADLAELYPGPASLEPGTIVALGPDGNVTAAGPEDEPIGVVSTDPGHVMGQGTGNVPVALEGRVPVRVDERLETGEQVIVGSDGIGTDCTPPDRLSDAMQEIYCDSQSIGVVKEQHDASHAIVVLD